MGDRPLALMTCIVLGAAQAAAAQRSHEVRIEAFKFVPEQLEVHVGDTVVWTNKDFVPHSVTAPAARVESGDLNPDRSWKFTARARGEIPYICRLHPVMKGVLIVK
jgi:plastocyanin